MAYTIVGLGNVGEEYQDTRHNVGRIILDQIAYDQNWEAWKEHSKAKALVLKEKIGKENVAFVLPNTMMNRSGVAVREFVTSEKKANKLVVIYDDIDLPFGQIRVSFNRSSGGHRGLESIIKQIKTKAFIRLRVGVAPTTPSGKIKKPHGEDAVVDFLLGDFKPKEIEIVEKNISKTVYAALQTIAKDGHVAAMNEFN